MAELTFEFTFDGPALSDGEMPVRDLAPSLLALAELFTVASNVTYPGREPIGVNIKATGEGSFTIHLALESKKAWDAFVDLSGSHGASALANLYQLVGGTAGLFAYIKYKAWRRARTADDLAAAPGNVKITLPDGTVLEFPPEVLDLYERPEARRKAVAVVAPLRREGVREARFSSDDTLGAVVREDDVSAYDEAVAEEEEDGLLTVEQEAFVEVRTANFAEGRWRLGLSENVNITAAMEDAAFRARIDAGEPFRKGDYLRCRMRVVQTGTPKGIHSEYAIIEVLEHFERSADQQLELSPGNDDDAAT